MCLSLALSCNIRSFVIELDYGYRSLLEVYSELSSICFLSWLHYYSMISLHNCPVLEIVSLLFLELYQLFQYSYDCSSVVSVHPEGGGSARDTRVSVGTPGLGYPLLLCLGKSLVVILNYVQQPDPCGPEPCSPDNGPGPVPWLGKVREHHVLREHHVFPEEAALSPNSRRLQTSH